MLRDRQSSKLFCLLGILLLAAFFRLWQLDQIPPGLYPDVAIYGNDALDTLKTGNFRVFYPENNGREGLWMWMLALSFSIFGVSIWSIKIVAAIIGILTVLGLYLFTKELFFQYNENSSRCIPYLASFFLAISFWHTNFSRLGFRAILVPFVLVFAFYFLFKGFREKKIIYLLISGLFFGLGFYTYISYRFIVLLLPLILLFWWLSYRKQNLQKFFILKTFYLILVIIIVALPIGIYFLQNPQDFFGRAGGVSIFNTENPIKEFFKSLVLHLGMFNFYGDQNWRHNFSGSPMLFWPIGILFLIGFFIGLREIFRKSNYQNQNYQLLSIFYFLISAFFIMLLPGILTYEGIPHALRVIGAIPVVYILAGFGGSLFYRYLSRRINKKFLIVLCSLFFILLTYNEFNKYFFQWAKNPEVEGAFEKRYLEIGNFLNSLPADTQKYVIVNELGSPLYGISIPGQSPMFIEATKFGKPRSIYLRAEEIDQIQINSKKTIILPLYPKGLFEELSEKFPQGKVKESKDLWYYQIN